MILGSPIDGHCTPRATIADMARRLACAMIIVLGSSWPAFAAEDLLAKALQLYNQRQFRAAIDAAEQARLIPVSADAADLIAARAYIERYRVSATADDLTNARDRFRRLSPDRFSPHERTEYIVGLGETLFFDDAFGAAANVFGSVLRGNDLLTGPARERVVDWWATAIDRDTRPRSEIDRQVAYQRLRDRLEEELAQHPSSGSAAYWLAAAARAQGDLQAAWNAAQSGWVRAMLSADHGTEIRSDLDRLVTQVLAAERAKALAQPPETLLTEWERFKARWSK